MAINKNEIEVTEVNLTEKTILDFLNSGVTWYKKDDLGYGSIEEKYNANPLQIEMIRKHPSFKGVKTKVTIFNIIDDTKNAAKTSDTTTKESTSIRTNTENGTNMVPVDSESTGVASFSDTQSEAADIFANL